MIRLSSIEDRVSLTGQSRDPILRKQNSTLALPAVRDQPSLKFENLAPMKYPKLDQGVRGEQGQRFRLDL